jgi:hypothetical protein
LAEDEETPPSPPRTEPPPGSGVEPAPPPPLEPPAPPPPGVATAESHLRQIPAARPVVPPMESPHETPSLPLVSSTATEADAVQLAGASPVSVPALVRVFSPALAALCTDRPTASAARSNPAPDTPGASGSLEPSSEMAEVTQGPDFHCNVCNQEDESRGFALFGYTEGCTHRFCSVCLGRLFSYGTTTCPVCRHPAPGPFNSSPWTEEASGPTDHSISSRWGDEPSDAGTEPWAEEESTSAYLIEERAERAWRGQALCAVHNKWRDEAHLYQTGQGDYRCFSHRQCQVGPRPPLHLGKDKGKHKGSSKGKYDGYLIPLPSQMSTLKGEASKGKGESNKGKDKGREDSRPKGGKCTEFKGKSCKGKGPPSPAALPLLGWQPECWACGSPSHVRSMCDAVSAAEGLDPPPAGSCLECGVPGHARWQCPIHLRRPDGTGVILRCALHGQLRSTYNLIWNPTMRDWRCVLYAPCQ